jgi:hypothetical protein
MDLQLIKLPHIPTIRVHTPIGPPSVFSADGGGHFMYFLQDAKLVEDTHYLDECMGSVYVSHAVRTLWLAYTWPEDQCCSSH